MVKKQYSTPTLRSHGSMTAVTKQNRSGTFLDVTLSAGTPISQIVITLS